MNTAKVSAEQFAQRHPELFTLYRELMLVTLAAVDARTALLTRESDDQVAMVQRTFEAEVAAADAKFRRSTDIFNTALRDEADAARDELNSTLTRLLADKDEASKPFNDRKRTELRLLEAEKIATQQCFHELKVFSLMQTVADEFLEKAFRIIQHYDESLAPINARYSDEVRRAFDKYNERIARANSVCAELCEPHVLARMRAVRDATNKKQTDLLSAAVDRDERTESLRAMTAQFKEERTQEIERFLHDPNRETLRRFLIPAIEQMKERREEWTRALSAIRALD